MKIKRIVSDLLSSNMYILEENRHAIIIDPNSDISDFESSIQRENYMVGVPGKGGIMIYDVTALEATAEGQEAMSKWDMTHFTNIKDENGKKLEEIPYYFKPDGGIYFRKYEKIYNEVGAKIHDDGS